MERKISRRRQRRIRGRDRLYGTGRSGGERLRRVLDRHWPSGWRDRWRVGVGASRKDGRLWLSRDSRNGGEVQGPGHGLLWGRAEVDLFQQLLQWRAAGANGGAKVP